MLKLITGGNHTDRESVFIQDIRRMTEQGEDVIVIIPDQFSFEYDKMLYKALGAKNFNKITTVGFNRLAQLLEKQYGYDSKDNADDNAVIITMYKAVKQLKNSGDVRFYERALTKNSFIAESINLINEFIRWGVTPEDLRIASERTEGSLSSKLFDLSRLYEFFMDELEKAGLKNSLTTLGECCEIVKEQQFFKNKCVFIDSFSDFSLDEYKLIECAIIQAKMVAFSFTMSHDNKARFNQTPFAMTLRTIGNLKRLAMENNKNIVEEQLKSETDCNQEIKHIDVNLYKSKPDIMVNAQSVKLLSATDLYEEMEYVCAEISRLVREEGYKYKDIALLAGNVNEIYPVIEGVFDRYELPYFIDFKRGAGQSSLVIYLKSLMDCLLTRKWNTEKILRYVKSPLADFFDYDICDLENYCIKWNVNGDMWLNDFTAKADEGSLNRINQTRKAIIEPLQKFKESCNGATAKEICTAFYQLLENIHLSQQMFSKIKIASSLNNETEFELAREFKQLWQTVLSAVSAVYTNIDDKMSLREFYEILTLMISQMSVSNPPQKADCIRIGSTDRSRLSGVKVAFVVETNEGVFPANISNSGLLTNRDKKQLEKLEFPVINSSLEQIDAQRLNVYMALTMPTDKLYVTYSESDNKGEAKRPSVVVPMMNRMFENIVSKIQDIKTEFFCTSYRTAMYKYLENCNDRRKNISSIKESINSSPEYNNKLKSVFDSADRKSHKLSEQMAKELFFHKDLNMSATRVNDFYSCPFSYYCKYGLHLRKPYKVEINSLSTGNLVHSCFEKMMSTQVEGKKVYNEDFTKLSDKIIRSTIHEEFNKYIESEMGGDFGKNATFRENMKRLEQSTFHAVKNIQTEFENCLFVPEAFEFNLTKENGESILKLDVAEDIHINIRGSIDRADVFTDENGQRYIRIVDYKTGGTEFRLEDLYNGLNLQMLIYLLAVTQRINELNEDGKLKPSGILYSHIKYVDAKMTPVEIEELKENGILKEKVFIKRAERYKPDGMIVENEFTLEAMNKHFGYVFTPFKTSKSGSLGNNKDVYVTEQYFLGLEQFALRKIYELADKLKTGEIPADPISTKKGLKCTYCDYWGICGNYNPKNPRMTNKKADIEKLNEVIQELVDNTKKASEN